MRVTVLLKRATRLEQLVWWAAACLLLVHTAVIAKAAPTVFGSQQYDAAVPTVQSVLGYSLGEKITWAADTRKYFDALQAHAPNRVKIVDYGSTWEGRGLFYAVISDEKNMARLPEIQRDMARLADPRILSPEEAETLIQTHPAATWLSYGVHGNEISSPEAAMATAYHLIASLDDAMVKTAMRETVIIINPVQNPDGRDRFVHHFESASGIVADANMGSAEHDEPWPQGRTNHYLFDLNRDWFAQTQPETQAHAKAYLQWMPVAFVDAHEMGTDSTYFFAPEADPFNPHLTQEQREALTLFGKTNARRFDAMGADYYTREVFDALFPGYGASWPFYHGSIGMTYEQASARGLVATRYDGTKLTYAETIRNHFAASLGTIETVVTHRELLLSQFYDYRRSAISEGEKGKVRSFIFPKIVNSDGALDLAKVLARQGVEVSRALEDFSLCGENVSAGSFFVNLNQPRKRLIQTLLEQDVELPEAFMAQERARADKGLASQIYDVTAWSLPLMFDAESIECSRRVSARSEPFTLESSGQEAAPWTDAGLVYIVPWGSRSAARFMTKALRAGVKMKGTDLPFVHQGRRYGRGTLVINVHQNADDVHAIVRDLSQETGADVVAADESWVTQGPNFGSDNFVSMAQPKIAMLWDAPTSAYSAGSTRFTLEQLFNYPMTIVRTQSLSRFDLDDYDVFLIPDGSYRAYLGALGPAGIQTLRRWVEEGGVLISIAGATSFLAHPDVDLLSVRRERMAQDPLEDEGPGASSAPDDDGLFTDGTVLSEASYRQAIADDERQPKRVTGAIARAEVDGDHWMSAGVSPNLKVLVRGTAIYTPSTIDQGANVVRFAAQEDLLVSGFMWEGNQKQLAYKPFVAVEPKGAGVVIGFTQDPNFRAQQNGLNVLFLNAIFRGASQVR